MLAHIPPTIVSNESRIRFGIGWPPSSRYLLSAADRRASETCLARLPVPWLLNQFADREIRALFHLNAFPACALLHQRPQPLLADPARYRLLAIRPVCGIGHNRAAQMRIVTDEARMLLKYLVPTKVQDLGRRPGLVYLYSRYRLTDCPLPRRAAIPNSQNTCGW